MPMIVANKKRIASLFNGYPIDLDTAGLDTAGKMLLLKQFSQGGMRSVRFLSQRVALRQRGRRTYMVYFRPSQAGLRNRRSYCLKTSYTDGIEGAIGVCAVEISGPLFGHRVS
jgi:hypothetical protein